MVNAAQTVDTGSSGLPLFARASSASAVLSSGATATDSAPASAETVAPASSTVAANLSRTLRYNSFEFSYRQDFGKIVLLRQEPETGELVQQFPSEYYLARYAQSERAARQLSENASQRPDQAGSGSESNGAASVQAAPAQPATANVAGSSVVSSAPVAVPSAPALPSGGVTGGVDITV